METDAYDEADDWCDVPPLGWRCTRTKGHDGPCAAYACPEDIDFVASAMERLREKPAAESEDAALMRNCKDAKSIADTT